MWQPDLVLGPHLAIIVGPNLAAAFCPRTKSGGNILSCIRPNLAGRFGLRQNVAARFGPRDTFWVGHFCKWPILN